jgi:hypothetical protein
MAKEYREKVEKELREICYDVLVSTLSFSVWSVLHHLQYGCIFFCFVLPELQLLDFPSQ